MKITKVNIQNLNSLQGNQPTVDFEKSPLGDAGVFAITGETGAGKTTILDAITIALYGKTPRGQEEEIMTEGTGECFSEVEFKIKNDYYRAKWSRHRSRKKHDGKLQSSKRELAKKIGDRWEIISTRKNEIDSNSNKVGLIEELTGLGFEQFRRSVMLAQGEFAKFLKSDEKQRSELLERITGTGIYSEISKAAFDRHKVEKNKLHDLTIRLKGIEIWNEETIKLKREQQIHLEQQRLAISNQLTDISNQLKGYEELEKTNQKLVKIEIELSRLFLKQPEITDKEAILKIHKKAVRFQPQLALLRNQSKTITNLENQLVEVKTAIQELLKYKKDSETALHHKQTAWQELEAVKEEKEALFQEIMALDIKIGEQKKPLIAKKKTVTTLIDELATIEQKLEKLKIAQRKNAETIENLESWLQAHQVDGQLQEEIKDIAHLQQQQENTEKTISIKTKEAKEEEKVIAGLEENITTKSRKVVSLEGMLAEFTKQFNTNLGIKPSENRGEDLAALEEEIKVLRAKKDKLATFENDAKIYENDERHLKKIIRELTNADDDKNDYKRALAEKVKEEEAADKELKLKEKIYDFEQRFVNLEKERASLEDGKPCPLCLSEEHPCHDEHHTPQVSEAKTARDEALKTLTVIREQRAKLETALDNVMKSINKMEREQDELDDKIRGFEMKIKEVPTSAVQIFNSKGSRGLEELIAEYEEQLSRQEQRKAILVDLDRKITQEAATLQNLKADVGQLQVKKQNATNNFQRVNKERQVLLEEREEAVTKLEDMLSKYQMIYTDKALVNKLKKRHTDFQNNEHKLLKAQQISLTLAQDIAYHSEQAKKLANDLAKEKSVLQEMETGLESIQSRRIERFGIANPKKEQEAFRQKLAKKANDVEAAKLVLQEVNTRLVSNKDQKESLEKSLTENRKSYELAMATCLNDIQAAGFDNIESLEAATLPENRANQIDHDIQGFKQELAKKQQSQTDLKDTLAELLEIYPTTDDKEILAKQHKSLLLQQDEVLQELGAIKEGLANNERHKAAHREQLKAINLQQKECNRWAKLDELIGSADGKKFRTFAQGLTLQRLVLLANRHLHALNDRYTIAKEKDKDLELAIIDGYKANQYRSVNTLSGGESFLVSLALALGLSDLAGKNTQIHSLFIDEGFGTLDANTLDIAIQTLENLQSQGKIIGIISHVQELKERIGTQIRVEKIGSGRSTIRIQ